ncbi:MAG TPA: GNAT family N-acetyltransferase [Terriglobales bacterium]|nr:GNAT family N-acetyltransferase [Terriglobales bacterium]
MKIQIMPMRAEDWPAVREIYAQGIATGNATFETAIPDWVRWDETHHKHCRLIARDGTRTLGWAALSPVSRRRVYAGVAEVSIYVADGARRGGVGKALLKNLIEQSEKHGIWTLQAGIFPDNVASIALHKSCGFREVGVRQRLGQLAGVWRDVVLLERRSSCVGA